VNNAPPVQPDWLILTKLLSPPRRDDVIPRPHLLQTLTKALRTCKLTLLSAPAGYGKTTLLSHWRWSNGQDHPQVAWLSLDEGDNDISLFLAYLNAALRRLSPAVAWPTPPLKPGNASPDVAARRGIGLLVNAVAETLSGPFALILDDLHRLDDPAVYLALDYLLERMPPQMHLVIATRYDPPLALARLRARGELTELRMRDLCFSREEAEMFLNTILHLDISPDELLTLYQRVEGWAAGLRLLGASLHSSEDRARFFTHLAHTERYVADFLTQEVLNRQKEPMRTFLLETCILHELTAPLCQAITGRDDAQRWLIELGHRNLLVAAADENGLIWRYHPTFAEFLQERLRTELPDRLPDLYHRAAQAETRPVRAIAYYLAAQQWKPAAHLIEQVGHEMLSQGLMKTLTGWIRTLPEPILNRSPRLLYLLGAVIWHKKNIHAGQKVLEQALQGFEACGDVAGQGEALAQLANCVLVQGQIEHSHTLAQRALDCPLSPPDRVQVMLVHAWSALLRGDVGQASTHLDAVWTMVQTVPDPEPLHRLFAHIPPLFVVLPTELDRIEQLCDRISTAPDAQNPFLRRAIARHLAFVHLYRGQLTESIEAAQTLLAASEQWGGHVFFDVNALIVLVIAHAARGEYEVANRYMATILDDSQMKDAGLPTAPILLYAKGRTHWLQQNLASVDRIYHQLNQAQLPDELPLSAVVRHMLGALLATAEGEYPRAERILQEAVETQRSAPLSTLAGDPRLLLAYVYVRTNRANEALAEFVPLLKKYRQENRPGFILQEGEIAISLLRLAVERNVQAEYATRLLRELGADGPARPFPIVETGETLTPREVQVLQLIATGASNRDIAEQLVVSINTVKSHVVHILRKLDVTSRTEATARAQELGITPTI
jgi:LuxR family maltose regulon positive regulatory protein